jgi:hypothetical protein
MRKIQAMTIYIINGYVNSFLSEYSATKLVPPTSPDWNSSKVIPCRIVFVLGTNIAKVNAIKTQRVAILIFF